MDITADPAVADLLDEFSLFDDWEDRYRHVIDLGRTLPALPDSERTEDRLVSGCASRVWLLVDADPTDPARLRVRGDSDAHIVKGLAAILARLYGGRPAAEAAALDPAPVLGALGLGDHLSAQRANGVASMARDIRAAAVAMAGAINAEG